MTIEGLSNNHSHNREAYYASFANNAFMEIQDICDCIAVNSWNSSKDSGLYSQLNITSPKILRYKNAVDDCSFVVKQMAIKIVSALFIEKGIICHRIRDALGQVLTLSVRIVKKERVFIFHFLSHDDYIKPSVKDIRFLAGNKPYSFVSFNLKPGKPDIANNTVRKMKKGETLSFRQFFTYYFGEAEYRL